MKTKNVCAFGVGIILPNGAEIHKIKPSNVKGWSVVIAWYLKGYVTWNMQDKTGECQSGHYHSVYGSTPSKAWDAACEDFERRK